MRWLRFIAAVILMALANAFDWLAAVCHDAFDRVSPSETDERC